MLNQSKETKVFYCSVIQQIAASPNVNVPDWQIKPTVQLRQEIEAIAPEVLTLLDNFLLAYQDWYHVHVKIYSEDGGTCEMTPTQRSELLSTIAERDLRRKSLLNALR